MSTENDDFVDGLLRGLSKAEPMSEFEIRKFEKLIDQQASDYKKSTRTFRFKLPASVAASIAIAFGAAFLLTNHGAIIKNVSGVTRPSAEQPSRNPVTNTGHSTNPTPQTPGQNSGSQSNQAPNQVFGNSESSDGKNGTVAVSESNLDYSTDLTKIKAFVKVGQKPGSVSSLNSAEQQCAIKQGIASSLLAFDKGYYQSQRVSAYFSGPSKTDMRIILVDVECNVVQEL